ncbi:hypothetical protein H0H92_011137 [Tricholoma furcatifolium]|nr:hypothetical protein H0H92_011137 [Tricholoma furcatifolium]
MSAAVAVPQHQLLDSPNSRSIKIFDWFITASTNPISNAPECDTLHASLGFPLPEMTFGRNHLTLEHRPSGWKYTFTTEAALQTVRNGELREGDGGVKVGYADEWLKSRFTKSGRTGPSSNLPMPKTAPTKVYDWTYTAAYKGNGRSGAPSDGFIASWTQADPNNSSHAIPMAELTRPDPILFYAEVPLFEDELHDNGSSSLIVRIPPVIIRETNGWEAPYDRVKRQLPKYDDLTPLTDPNFIAKVLTGLPTEVSQENGAGTGWRELKHTVELAVLD